MKRIAAVSFALFLAGSSSALADQQKPDPMATPKTQVQNGAPATATDVQPVKCHWWQFGRCDVIDPEGLPPEASRSGAVITVDTSNNVVYLYHDGELVAKGPAATGMEKGLEKGARSWYFHTPRGRMKVLRKIVDPVWTRPDWAFIEEGKPVPPPDSPKRQVRGHLGKYALDLGDGILIHGTKEKSSLGRNASHGCIRVDDDLLEKLYRSANVGTEVYVF